MARESWPKRLVFGGALAFVGAAVFVVVSSYLIERELPRWVAGTVGALAFPVLPGAWHLWGERRRKRRLARATVQPRASLTGGDRFLLRCLVVALLVIGPMVYVGGTDVLAATWAHGTWFIPRADPCVRARAALLARVPADAELVIAVCGRTEGGQLDGAGVLAIGAGQVMVASDPVPSGENLDEGLAQLNAARERFPWLKVAPISKVSSSGPFLAASDGWRSLVTNPGAGPNAELAAELARAPGDATMVGAMVPRTTKDVLSTRRAAMWIVATQERLIVDGRLEGLDAAAAEKLVAEARAEWASTRAGLPGKCSDQIDQALGGARLDRDGALVLAHAELDPQKLLGVFFCGAAAFQK
jgi:hypothetical protein